MPRARAVFLDRDGVLIEEVPYLSDPKKLKLTPGAARAIGLLRKAGFKAIVVTNQSGVGRGYLTLATLRRIHRKLRGELRTRGARLDALYYCPHAPEAGCACRKPKTLMLERAARRFGLDVARSFFVGDTTSDLKAARDAGCVALLVRTGEAGKDGRHRIRADKTFKNLASAARWILSDAARAR